MYEETDDYGLGGVPIRPKILRAEDVEYKEHDVVFSEIQEVVIQGIRDAKYTIWAAVFRIRIGVVAMRITLSWHTPHELHLW